MDEEKDEDIDSQNDTEDTEKVDDDESAQDESEENGDKPKYTDAEKKAYARMKKAEADAKELRQKLADKEKSSKVPEPKEADIDKLLDAKLEKRELEALDLSDELKKEVQTYAKTNNVSIKQALGSKYITFLKDEEEKKERSTNASIGSGRRASKKDYSEVQKATDFDMSTPEGRAEFAKYRDSIRKKMG
jgi:hypothetical protein